MSPFRRCLALLAVVVFCNGCNKKTETQPAPQQSPQTEQTATTALSKSKNVEKHSEPDVEPKPQIPKERKMNALAKSQSPYLLQHADNPVDWVEWGDEAFERARKEGKPILLSIGYSTCHWCHVMAHESFENETVAKFINEHFIAIKLDREERPDVDRIYMTYVQSTTGSGGWPMTVFLTPERVPFYGGTYFPRDRFMGLLETITELWDTKREEFTGVGQKFVDYLQEQVSDTNQDPDSILQPEVLLKNAVYLTNQQYDETYAGFGTAPKFPRPVQLTPMITYARFHPDDPLAQQVMDRTVATLHAMANGGMYDHIGGGFHRYSVDKYWHVPHFEKMMYDQGQLATVYANLGMLLKDEKLTAVAEDICNYVQQRMTDPSGGLYSAEDADSLTEHGGHESKEGAYYVWPYKELVELLGEEEAKLCAAYYQSTEQGNVRPESDPLKEFTNLNVLTRVADTDAFASSHNLNTETVNQKIATWRKTLYEARSNRPDPHLDDKILVSWNSLMISGFVRTYVATGNQSYLESAEAAVGALRNLCWDDQEKILYRLFRGKRGSVRGFADDYAMLIQALIDLHEANGSSSALQWASELQQILNTRFAHQAGGWYETDGLDDSLLSRMQESYEGAEPSANSVSVRNCFRLASLLGDENYAQQAQKTLTRFAGQMQQQSQGLPTMISSRFIYSHNVPSVVIVQGKQADQLRAAFHEAAVPGSTLLSINEQTREFLQAPWLIAMKNRDGIAQAFVCEGKSCKAPTTELSVFSQQLQAALQRLSKGEPEK